MKKYSVFFHLKEIKKFDLVKNVKIGESANFSKNNDFFVAGKWVHQIGSNFTNRLITWEEQVGKVWADLVSSFARYEKIMIFRKICLFVNFDIFGQIELFYFFQVKKYAIFFHNYVVGH